MPTMKSVGPRSRNRSQQRSSKHTAWKKKKHSRGYGAFHYIPATALPTPLPYEQLPLLVENRAHRDFYFPLTGEEVLARIRQLPTEHIEGLTHVWMRFCKPGKQRSSFGSYCTGPGYRVIVLHPWPRNLQWKIGRKHPQQWWHQIASQYGAVMKRDSGKWHLQFDEEQVRRFYLDDLILHEVGHHVDSRRHSAANYKEAEEFADQYALEWSRKLNDQSTKQGRAR